MKTLLTTIFALFIGVQFIAAQNSETQPAKDTKATGTQSVQPAQTTQPAVQSQPVQISPGSGSVTAQPAVPKNIAWNENTHDFGKVKQNDPAEVTFTFKNTGDAPVVVTSARSSCGCTVAEYTKEPVKPGATGTVKATYNSARVGAFNKSVTVTFEGNSTPDVLTIKGEVEAAAPAPPASTPNQ